MCGRDFLVVAELLSPSVEGASVDRRRSGVSRNGRNVCRGPGSGSCRKGKAGAAGWAKFA